MQLLTNGRKQKEQVSLSKIRQFIKMTEQSTYVTSLSKSASSSSKIYLSQHKKATKGKENFSIAKSKQKADRMGISSVSILSAKINFTKPKIKDSLRQDKTKKRIQMLLSKEERSNDQSSEELPYFIECMSKQHRLLKEMHVHVQQSILTFKEFYKVCQNARSRVGLSKLKPETIGRKTIVFDMDETLIHTNERMITNYELKVPFRSCQGKIAYGFVAVRPDAKEILQRLSKHFDIILFTASSQAYADPILNHIDPENVIQHRLYREHCTLIKNQIFVKDLRILNRKLQNVVLVDNAPHSYLMQLLNGIPILPYYRGGQDKQLLKLEEYLMKLKDVDDVRLKNMETFRLHDYMKFNSVSKVFENVYSKWFRYPQE